MLLLLYLGVKAQTYCMFLEKKTILKIWLKSSVKINHLSRNHDLELVVTDLFTLWRCINLNRPFPSSPGPLFQNDGRCSASDMEIIFHFHANKTHFHKKGCAPSLILKVRVFGTRKWPISYLFTTATRSQPRDIQGASARLGHAASVSGYCQSFINLLLVIYPFSRSMRLVVLVTQCCIQLRIAA